MQQYTDWAPKEFDEGALGQEAPPSAGNQPQQQQRQAATSADAPQPGGAEPAPQQPQESNFVYDAASGTERLHAGCMH